MFFHLFVSSSLVNYAEDIFLLRLPVLPVNSLLKQILTIYWLFFEKGGILDEQNVVSMETSSCCCQRIDTTGARIVFSFHSIIRMVSFQAQISHYCRTGLPHSLSLLVLFLANSSHLYCSLIDDIRIWFC